MTSFKIFRQSQDCVKSVFVYPNVLRPPPSPEMEQHCLQLSVFPMRDYNCTPNGHRDGKVRHMLVALRLHRDKEIKERNKQRKRANYSIFPYELIVKWDRYQHNKTCIIPILILVCVAGQTGLVSFITARFITQFIIFPPAKTIHKHGPFHQSMLDADLLKTAGRENSFGCTRTKKKNNTHHCTGKQKSECVDQTVRVTAEMKAKMKTSHKHRNFGCGIAIRLCKTEKLPGQIVHNKTTKLPHLIPSCTLHWLHEGNLGHVHFNRHLYCIMSSNKYFNHIYIKKTQKVIIYCHSKQNNYTNPSM